MNPISFTLLEQDIYLRGIDDPDKVAACRYLEPLSDRPVCIVGHALVDLGVDKAVIREHEGQTFPRLRIKFDKAPKDLRLTFARMAQVRQDTYAPWGQAVSVLEIKPSRPSKQVRERIPAEHRSRENFMAAALMLANASWRITEDNWIQGFLWDHVLDNPRACAIGHVSFVATGGFKYQALLGGYTSLDVENTQFAMAVEMANIEAGAKYAYGIDVLNDGLDTKMQDVKDALLRAAWRCVRLAHNYKEKN